MEIKYLYHGSDVVVSEPSLIRGKIFHDFGKAFYLTKDYSQAFDWAKTKVKRHGFINSPKVSIFKLDTEKLEKLKILTFNSPTKDWLDYVIRNRNSKSFALNTNYDLICGPVVDGSVSWYNIARYSNHELSFEETLNKLRVDRLVDQWAFKTEAALDTLTFKGVKTHE